MSKINVFTATVHIAVNANNYKAAHDKIWTMLTESPSIKRWVYEDSPQDYGTVDESVIITANPTELFNL